MRFSSLIEQSEIINKLINIAKEGRVSHAQLFSGQDSSKVFAICIAFAQYLNCTNKIKFSQESSIIEDSCGKCPSCKKIQSLNHPDLHFIFPNTTTKQITSKNSSKQLIKEFKSYVLDKNAEIDFNSWYDYIDVGNKQGMINVRDANDILADLSVKSYEAKYKIMIIWGIDKLNYDAAPKLLKIIEEPYENTLFFLITNNRENILPTILSRTQLIKIPDIKGDNKAVDLYQLEIFVDWMRTCFKVNSKIEDIVLIVDKIISRGREEQKKLLLKALEIFEKSFLINQKIPITNPLIGIEKRFRDNFPNFVSQNNIDKIYNELNNAILHIERNGNSKLIFLDLSIKIGFLLNNK